MIVAILNSLSHVGFIFGVGPPFLRCNNDICKSATTVKLLCISYDLLHTTGHHYSCAFEVGFSSCNYKTSDFAERFTKTSIKFGNHY